MTTAAPLRSQLPGAFSVLLRIAETVMLADGWRRRLIACGAGAGGALAMAPVDVFPAMIVPMTIAVWLLDGSADAGLRRAASLFSAFGIGWWWGFGYFLASLWWLGAAFLVEADKFAWLLPLGVIGLPAFLAFFPALGFALARLIWSPGPGRILALAAGLSLSEWLRGHAFSGFPWNAFGMALGGNLVTAQFASVVGLYGLTVLTIAICAAPATLIDRHIRAAFSTRWFVRTPVGLALLVFMGLAIFGAIRLAPGTTPLVKGISLRIMQPNLAQDAKFRPENGPAILAHYLSLSDRSTGPAHTGLADVSVLIWPESAFPFILSRTPQALAQIAAVLSPNSVLVTGAAREEDLPADKDNPKPHTVFFNAVQVVDKSGVILESYDKVHLVPFGEYLPFSTFLNKLGLRQFVHMPGGFEAGSKHVILNVPGLPPVVPLICYEAIFPGDVMPSVPGERPGLLLNLTNDGWFGNTAGPYQHFAQARLRTIEEGLPLVRAANSGISAIVDPYGRVLSELSLGREGLLDGGLPQRLGPPIFAHLPFISPFLVWLIAISCSFIFRRQV
ncbi:apolipoprotein N-acyltransferase [Methyloferula stellata]|uniref:apolipoprotein N-acyltransferase n=1 Tax=Methyloferula stellata TaxID=876270 RepID=UPI00037B4967|nr:apolipoprotein N-acyltransferase [Methyloferula stellata]